MAAAIGNGMNAEDLAAERRGTAGAGSAVGGKASRPATFEVLLSVRSAK